VATPYPLPSNGKGRRFEPCTAHQMQDTKPLFLTGVLFSSIQILTLIWRRN